MSPALPRELLARHALLPKKSWGQNFLGNAELATRIAELATTPAGGTVVEIGPASVHSPGRCSRAPLA